MKYFMSTKFIVTLAILALVLYSCSTIAKFDQYAYSQTTSLKVDAINIMGHASDKYNLHAAEVTNLQTSLNKMYEYERNRPKNEISQKMWTILIDSTGNLYGGFIKRWQKEGTLDTAFIRASQTMIGQSFDQISQLESGKIKPSQIN